jgi:cell filamentation protein
MTDNTNWTPSPEGNKLNISDFDLINQIEAKGIASAELHIFGLDSDIKITTQLILEIHRIAFEELYDWAGNWRLSEVVVGQLFPPPPNMVLQLMYQFLDHLNYKIDNHTDESSVVECLLYAHYEFVRIHPFNNGNGRTGRMLMNLVALRLGYQPIDLYHRDGDARKTYIAAMKEADRGNEKLLADLIRKELVTF